MLGIGWGVGEVGRYSFYWKKIDGLFFWNTIDNA